MKRFHRSVTAVFVSRYTIKDAMLFSSPAKNICSCSFDAEYAGIKRHAVLILSVLIYWSVHCGSNKAVKWCSATFGSVPSRTQTPCSAVQKDIYAKMFFFFFLCRCDISVVVGFYSSSWGLARKPVPFLLFVVHHQHKSVVRHSS